MVDNKKTNHVAPEREGQDNSGNYIHSSWSVGRIFWGLTLILVGGLMIADNFGLTEVNWADVWRLWPLIIVAFGLSILSLHNQVWRIITIILAVLIMGAVAWVMVSGFPTSDLLRTSEISIQKISDNIKQADINIKAGASSLNIGSADQDTIVKSKLESNISSISEASSVTGENQQINLTMGSSQNIKWWFGSVRNIWTIDLKRDLPMNVNVDIGASDAKIDLSEARTKGMNLKFGASSLTLKLGSKEPIINVNMELGASSVIMRLPSDSGIQFKMDSGLTSNKMADLTKINDGVYESPNYDQSNNKINISGKAGASSITIERY